jgi:hypothetical protein
LGDDVFLLDLWKTDLSSEVELVAVEVLAREAVSTLARGEDACEEVEVDGADESAAM